MVGSPSGTGAKSRNSVFPVPLEELSGIAQILPGIMPQDANSVLNLRGRRDDTLADVISDCLGRNTQGFRSIHYRVKGLAIDDDHKEVLIPRFIINDPKVRIYRTFRTVSMHNIYKRFELIGNIVKATYVLLT
ncbi:MAG TPA: hypothetical protein PLO63_11025 [Syntrophales bacterium]|nr:hypothetical protein [Syntrophales bacterium]